jgi:hypothetical protein
MSQEEASAQVGLRDLPEKENLVAFFELLIKVDKRVNPDLYD